MTIARVGRPSLLDALYEGIPSGDLPTASTVQIWVAVAGSRSYLQADLVSLGATVVNHTTTVVSTGRFRRSVTPISAMAEGLMEWEFMATGPLPSYPRLGSDEGLFVTVNTLDDLDAELDAIQQDLTDTAHSDIEPGGTTLAEA